MSEGKAPHSCLTACIIHLCLSPPRHHRVPRHLIIVGPSWPARISLLPGSANGWPQIPEVQQPIWPPSIRRNNLLQLRSPWSTPLRAMLGNNSNGSRPWMPPAHGSMGPATIQPPAVYNNQHESSNGYAPAQQQPQYLPQYPTVSMVQSRPPVFQNNAYNPHPAPPGHYSNHNQSLQPPPPPSKDLRSSDINNQLLDSKGANSNQVLNGSSVGPPVLNNGYNYSSGGYNNQPAPQSSVPSSQQVVYPQAPHAPFVNGYPTPAHPSPLSSSNVPNRHPADYPQRSHNSYASVPQSNSTAGQYPNQGVNEMSSRFGAMSVNRGWDQMWGKDAVNLMSEKNIRGKYAPPEEEEDASCDRDVMRSTLQKVPETSSMLQKSRLPFGILLHPFREDEVRLRVT